MTKKEYDHQRYLARRDAVLALRREYQAKHRNRLVEYAKKYYAAHRSKFKIAAKAYRETHKREIKNTSVKYYSDNRLKILAAKRLYHQRHPECSVATRENRRARNKLAGKLTVKLVQEAYERNIATYGRLTCYLCGLPIEFGQDSLEHRTPLVRGGTHEPENLGIAHSSCNSSKNIKTDREYFEYIILKSGVMDD